MSYEIMKQGGQWCVSGKGTMQCFASRDEAVKLRDSLMINESRATNEFYKDVSRSGGSRLFIEYEFIEAPQWIPLLPIPGTYNHPSYGEITVSKEGNQAFVDNFRNGIYQESLPIDAEHATKMSGACGWIVDMKMNADGSADGKVSWTDRGKTLLESDRFRYISPEWYKTWQQPDTQKKFQNVIIGAALTTRPFFKSPNLRSLVATEDGMYEMLWHEANEPGLGDVHKDSIIQKQKREKAMKDDHKMEEEEEVVTQEEEEEEEEEESMDYTETKNRLAAAEEALTESNAQTQKFAQALDRATKRIAQMEQDARAQRFSEMAESWSGDSGATVNLMNSLADAFGEDSEQFKAYIQQQQAYAAVAEESALFSEIGSSASAGPVGQSKLDELIQERVAAGESYPNAALAVARENRSLYGEYAKGN